MKKSLLAASVAALLLSQLGMAATQLDSEKYPIQIEKVTDGLSHPWGMAVMPDGGLLVTERSGNLRIISTSGQVSDPIKGLPAVRAYGQGGLLDVQLDPDFASNQWVYFSFSEPLNDGKESSTAVARAKLNGDSLSELEIIFRANPKLDSPYHFGSRLVFDRQGNLFITLGDRGSRRQDAQTLDTHHGKVVRISKNGDIPKDNPYINQDNALDEIWSLGHRNMQGAALHPQTGELWTHEHGPQGGDEINIARATKNYGWPVITYGEEYGGGKIGTTSQDGLEQPLYYWVPSIAPSGMMFYSGKLFDNWQGNLLVGSLKFSQLVRLELDGDKVIHEERMDIGQRVRDVEQGPDGTLYLLTDQPDGQLLKLTPAK
ncbi:PQQ-dependent sugar dehydrogenase [Bowmanella pacifica]|uniref:Glucose dehydrogenase n=1 Tax=Bowmanella pacifica TaxID=502051 RepID=A0A918DKQ2_9ALTE|nr:PQQ-dependent sugar dehydrogenase [Bowmanella pacifica]GGO72611.1 glucose dehydrogenase [Bowmanella pacifica]